MIEDDQSYKEKYYRLAKAIKLADVISASGIKASRINEQPNQTLFWQLACEGAGFEAGYYPSNETRIAVIQLLLDREATVERLLAMKVAAHV